MARREIHTEIEIAAPRPRVWSVLSDLAAYGEWNPWLTRVRGTLAVGQQLSVRAKLGDRDVKFKCELIRVEEGRGFCWAGHALTPMLFGGEHAFELHAVDETTTRLTHFEEFAGVLAGVLLAIVGAKSEQGFHAMNRALKERCEAGGAA